GVIHVGAEGKYMSPDGEQITKLNDNVLIEIGAAMALYGKKVILLVERGVSLPSNLQGLYRCDFEGDKLEYEATMKLLKTFSQFRGTEPSAHSIPSTLMSAVASLLDRKGRRPWLRSDGAAGRGIEMAAGSCPAQTDQPATLENGCASGRFHLSYMDR